jgi:cell division protein FtsL
VGVLMIKIKLLLLICIIVLSACNKLVTENEAIQIAVEYANKQNNLSYEYSSIKLENDRHWIVWVKAINVKEAMKITIDRSSGEIVDVMETE